MDNKEIIRNKLPYRTKNTIHLCYKGPLLWRVEEKTRRMGYMMQRIYRKRKT